MKTQKKGSLFRELAAATLLTGAAYSLLSLSSWLGFWGAGRYLIVALGIVYILFFLAQSGGKVGKFALGVLALVSLTTLAFTGASALAVVAATVGWIWAVRSLYAHASLLGSALDGALCLLSLGWAAGAYVWAASPVWAVWCFFFSQALYVFIPARAGRPKSAEEKAKTGAFDSAHSLAEAAIRQLARGDLG